jgi:hypothetical protein
MQTEPSTALARWTQRIEQEFFRGRHIAFFYLSTKTTHLAKVGNGYFFILTRREGQGKKKRQGWHLLIFFYGFLDPPLIKNIGSLVNRAEQRIRQVLRNLSNQEGSKINFTFTFFFFIFPTN